MGTILILWEALGCKDYVAPWLKPTNGWALLLEKTPHYSPCLTRCCGWASTDLSHFLLTTLLLTHPSPTKQVSWECSCLRAYALAVPSAWKSALPTLHVVSFFLSIRPCLTITTSGRPSLTVHWSNTPQPSYITTHFISSIVPQQMPMSSCLLSCPYTSWLCPLWEYKPHKSTSQASFTFVSRGPGWVFGTQRRQGCCLHGAHSLVLWATVTNI